MLRLIWILMIVQVFAGSIKDHFKYLGENAGTENVRFTINQVMMSQGDESYKFDYDYTGYVVEEGKPEFPVFSTMLEVDPFTSYRLEYEIIRSHIENNTSIRAAAEMTLDKNKHEQGLSRILSISEKYPSQFVQLTEPKVMRGHEIVHLEVIPFQFDPADQSLLVIDELEIRVIPENDRQPIRKREIPRNAAFSPVYKQAILNFSRTDEDSDLPPVIIYICGGNLANNANFQQLADWRHKRGYEVHIVPVSSIGSSTTSIKNYIQNAYDNWENPPSFICLVGDATGTYTIPTYHETYSDYYGEGDHPFSLLDGGDQIPDIIIGRLPVRSTSNMSTLATKILIYEKAIDTGNNWYEKAALIGDPSDSGISTIITGEYIEQVMEYEGFEDIRTNFGNGNYSNWMRNQMSEGMLYFSYRGFYDVSGFDQNDIDNTTNGNKLPFCTFLTCGTGSFEDAGVDGGSVCFSEKLVVAGSAANPKGCVTAISTATWGTHTMFNNAVNLGIYEGIFTHDVETAGEALTAGKIHLINSYPSNPNYLATIFCYWNNLMGDPAVHLWTDTPIDPIVQFDTLIPHGANEIEVIVLDAFDNPLENANVTLVKGDDEIFLSRLTGADGILRLPLDYSSTGYVSVTVTGKNIKPFEGGFTIDDNMASVNVESSEITIEDYDGNQNNIFEAGETVNLYIPLKNFGNVDITGVAATLVSEFELVSISTPGVSYGNIAVGEVAQSYPFEIMASFTVLDFEPLGLRLIILDDQGHSWETAVNVPISSGKLEINATNIAGNNDYLTPYGTSFLSLFLKNSGSMVLENVTGSLTPLSANINVVTEEVSWTSLPAGSIIESMVPFEIDVADGFINGTVVSFLLNVVSGDGFAQTLTLNLTVGQVTVNDPVGPDSYGYYIYDTGDVEYDLAPEYDWIELDPGYGGTGTDINITDNGNNQDESMVVDLPFIVRFYGMDYNEITICSNGWISFGESPMESFRNYNLPGAGGPSPMLAVFWDDLKTTSGGDVFTQYFPASGEETGMFIVEWSDVRTYDENTRESFQAILYDNIAITPPLGDNEIKLQYNEFNNTSNGDYNIDWWGNYPVHGAYCTIGIEDHSGERGLEYTFNNEYAPAAMQLSDGEALFITTRTGESFPPPTIEISQTEFNFNLGLDETYNDFFTFTNTGEQGSILIYSLDKTVFLNPGSGPDASGLMWSDSDREDALDFDWIDIAETGEEIYFIHNDVGSGPVNFGFEFPFYDETYTSCIVNPNGWIGFGEDSDDWSNSGLPSTNAPRPAILAFWDNLNPVSSDGGCSGEESGYAYFQSFSDKFVVTFDEVANCDGSDMGLYTFQIVLTLSGGISVNYYEMTGNVNSATIGVQNATGYIGHQVVHNGDYVHDQLTLLFDKEPEWLNLNTQTSGQLFAGEIKTVDYSINTSGYATGDYIAFVSLTSNAGEINPFSFSLEVDMGILGDVNDDSLVNVSDIVMIISFILEQNTPDSYQYWASDLNNDASINVVDIVILVDIIMGNL